MELHELKRGGTYVAKSNFTDKDRVKIKKGQILYHADCTTWDRRDGKHMGNWLFHNKSKRSITCLCGYWTARYMIIPWTDDMVVGEDGLVILSD